MNVSISSDDSIVTDGVVSNLKSLKTFSVPQELFSATTNEFVSSIFALTRLDFEFQEQNEAK